MVTDYLTEMVLLSVHNIFVGRQVFRLDFFSQSSQPKHVMSRGMIFPTMWYVRPAKAQTSVLIRAFASRLNIL